MDAPEPQKTVSSLGAIAVLHTSFVMNLARASRRYFLPEQLVAYRLSAGCSLQNLGNSFWKRSQRYTLSAQEMFITRSGCSGLQGFSEYLVPSLMYGEKPGKCIRLLPLRMRGSERECPQLRVFHD